jgi:D-arabinose 1-dehydrogenase-like Zn-dependent alcohol dehydrogenase
VDGTLMVIGAGREMTIAPFQLITSRRSIKGWYSGVASDSEDTMSFSVLTGVRSRNETFPLERAADAYDRMMSGAARFRAVLTMPR